MIYRTEIRDKVVCEQAIAEGELCDKINCALRSGKFLLDKNDDSSFAVVDLDFMMDVIQDREPESPFVYINFHGNWESHLLYDIVRDIICDIFYDVPETFVDYGDIVSIEYEVED